MNAARHTYERNIFNVYKSSWKKNFQSHSRSHPLHAASHQIQTPSINTTPTPPTPSASPPPPKKFPTRFSRPFTPLHTQPPTSNFPPKTRGCHVRTAQRITRAVGKGRSFCTGVALGREG